MAGQALQRGSDIPPTPFKGGVTSPRSLQRGSDIPPAPFKGEVILILTNI